MKSPRQNDVEFSWIRPLPPFESTSPSLTMRLACDESSDKTIVDFDPDLIAIGMTTAPRRLPTLDNSIDSVRYGQFFQTIHLFAEPETLVDGWTRTGVTVHQNTRRLGCYPNWLQAAQWLLDETSCPFLLLLEDDGVFCRGAAAALYYGLTHLESIGCLSLYMPSQNYRAGGHTESGWFPLRAPNRWGTVAQCFVRPVLERFVQRADRTQADGTDHHIDVFLRSQQLNWYSHVPSLVDHVGEHSTIGHITGLDNVGIGFQSNFSSYRNLSTNNRPKSPADATVESPLVSIVLPVFNGETFLSESIESCLRQSFSNFELIIVDDGSTDGTDAIIRSFRDPRIISIRHPVNRRLPAALNTGFRQSRGRFLTWTSCDNRFATNCLETLVDFLQAHPETDLVYSDFDFINENGAFVKKHSAGPTECLPIGNVVGMSFLYRREIYEAIGDYDDEAFLAEDYDYWLRASRQFRLTHLPMTLYEFRIHPDSLTSRFSAQIPKITQMVKSRNLDRD